MQAKGIKKLLLPLDGSKRSIETVHRLSAMKPFRSYRVVLLHVFNIYVYHIAEIYFRTTAITPSNAHIAHFQPMPFQACLLQSFLSQGPAVF